ncbi:MAG: hypothetical protein V2A64_07170 [Candidatus Omnitrophota bacterium]
MVWESISFLHNRKVYNILPKPPPDPALAGSKRLGLRKSPKVGKTCLPVGRESHRRRRFSWII